MLHRNAKGSTFQFGPGICWNLMMLNNITPTINGIRKITKQMAIICFLNLNISTNNTYTFLVYYLLLINRINTSKDSCKVTIYVILLSLANPDFVTLLGRKAGCPFKVSFVIGIHI